MRRKMQVLLVVAAGALAAGSCSSASEPTRAAPAAVTGPSAGSAGAASGTSGATTATTTGAGGVAVQTDVVEDRPGVALPARWPADLPRPDGAALQQSSGSGDAARDGAGGSSDVPPGDWALFVVPQAEAPAVGAAYGAKLRAAGLGVDERTVDAGGQQATELRVDVDPVAVARVLQVGPSAVVTVTLAPA